MKNKFTKKHKHVLIIKGTQGMAKLSLAAVSGLFTIVSRLFVLVINPLISSAPCARMLSFFDGLFNRSNQHHAGSTTCARALSQLGAGRQKNQGFRASSTTCARALSLLGIFAMIIVLPVALLLTTSLSLSPNKASAATSNSLNFQGRLLTNTGALVPDGTYNVQFNLYYVSTAGSSQWTETRTNQGGNPVTIQNGYYSVYLGDTTSGGTAFPTNIDWSEDLYLGMTVRGTGTCAFGACTPADSEMTPRFKLTAVPYALRASNVASSATNAASTDSNDVSITTGNALGATSNSGDITVDTGTATGTAGAILLGTGNASALTIGRSGITTTLQGSVAVTGAGTALTVTNNAQVDGNTTLGNNAGVDTLTVNAASTFTGNLTINTGNTFTNAGSSLYTAVAISNIAGGGAIGTAAATVDGATTFNINQTTAGQALTLPAPTVTTAGRVVYVNNVGSASFTMYGTTIGTSGSNAFIWNGTAWITTVSLSGSSVSVVGTIDSQTKSSDGAVIVGNAIYLQTADVSNVGLVSIAAQTFNGVKTFDDGLVVTAGGATITAGDLAVNSDMITSDGFLTINSTSYVRIGDSGTPGVATGDDDLYVEGDLEADGVLNVAGRATFGEDIVSSTTGIVRTLDRTVAGDSVGFTLRSGATVSGNTGDFTLRSGNATGGNAGSILIDSGTSSGGSTGSISLGTVSASAITIGRTGVTTTNAGALTVSQLLTGSLGATISGATTSINASSNFNTNINTGTSTGTVAIGNSASTTTVLGITNINTTGTAATSIGNSGAVTTLAGSSILLNSATLQRTAAGTTSLDLVDGANTTLALMNSGAGVANLTIDGNLTVAGSTITFSNAGFANCNLTTVSNVLTCGTDNDGYNENTAVVGTSVDSTNILAADYTANGNTGAAADGDQVEINAAIDAVNAAGGGTVFLLEGTYTIDATIDIDDDVQIVGSGRGATIVQLASGINTSTDIFSEDSNPDNFVIRDLSIDVNSGGQTSGTYVGIDLNDTGLYAGGLIDNVEVYNFTRASDIGVSSSTSNSLKITNSSFYNGSNAVWFDGTAAELQSTISNNTFDDIDDVAIYLQGVTQVTVENNIIDSSDGVGTINAAIYLDGASYINIVGNAITGGNIRGIHGISIVNYLTITGNTISDIDDEAIYGTFGYSSITANEIYFSGGAGDGQMYFSGGDFLVISDNVLDGNAGAGADFGITFDSAAGAPTNSVISGNNIFGHASHGITFEAGADSNTITNNSIGSNGGSGIDIAGSDDNIISNNRIYSNGGSGATDGIALSGDSNDNQITGNRITDTAGTGQAIDLQASTVDNTYLADNTYSGTGAASISNSGTNTIFANQRDSSGNLELQAGASGSIELLSNVTSTGTLTFSGVTTDITTGTNEALTITPNGTGDIVLSVDANSDVAITNGTESIVFTGAQTFFTSTSGETIKVEQTGTSLDVLIVDADFTGATGIRVGGTITATDEIYSSTFAGAEQGLFVGDGSANYATIISNALAGDYNVAIPTITANDTFCLQAVNNCAYLSASLSDNIANALDIQEGTNNYININTTNSSENISFGNATTNPTYSFLGSGTLSVSGSVSIAAGQSLRVVGGNTASRPGSPTEGMIYFDTDTDSLLTYANGKWQSDRGEYVVVAANDSTQAEKDSADYVADGTSDETEINSALTAAAGGKVILLAGTYTIDGSISVPNDTVLSGSGRGTIIVLDSDTNNVHAITNSDQTTGTGVVIRDLAIDGDSATNANSHDGVNLVAMGSSTRDGALLENLYVYDFDDDGVELNGSDRAQLNNIVSESNVGSGLQIAGTTNTSVVNSVFNDNTAEGVLINGNSYYTSLTNITASSNDSGVYVDGLNGWHVSVTASKLLSNTTYGFRTNSDMGLLSNNSISSNGTGVSLVDGAVNNTIDGNIIEGNDTGIYSEGNSTSSNTITDNTFNYNGGSTDNDAIIIAFNSDNTYIADNYIADDSCSSTCAAITIGNSNADNVRLSNNILANGTISDSGTGTIYAGQTTATTGNVVFRQANSATAFAVQNASGTSVLNVNTSTAGVTVDGTLAVTGNTTLTGDLAVNGDDITSDGDLTITPAGGDTIVTGTLAVTTLGAADTNTFLCRNSTNQLATCSSTPLTNSLTDNIANAFDLQEGTNNYININTTNSSENISFGNTTTNPTYSFLGSGTATFTGDLAVNGGDITSTGSLTVTAGSTGDVVIAVDDDTQLQVTGTVTNTGAAQAINVTLGDDANQDIVAGLQVNVTSANSGDFDNIFGLYINNVTPFANTWEAAVVLGSGYDIDLAVTDTTAVMTVADGGTFSFNGYNGSIFDSLVTITDAGTTGNLGVTGNGDFAGTLFAGTGDAFQVSSAGAVTAVGVNSGTGLLQGTGGLTLTGTTSVNATGAGTTTIGSAAAGAISLQSASTVGVTGTTSITGLSSGVALTVSNSTSTGNIVNFNDNATTVASIADGGAFTLQNSVNSTSALNVSNAAGSSQLKVDTTNNRVVLGSSAAQDYWTTGVTGGTARTQHAAAKYGNKLYYWGGGAGGLVNSLDIYDTVTDTWTTGASGGTARRDAKGVESGGKLYFWGGVNSGGTKLNTMDIYDIATNTWTTGATGGTARFTHGVAVSAGKIYYWGGYNSANAAINTVDIYDIAGNSWTTGTTGGTARGEMASTLYNGKIYFWAGSTTGSNQLNSMDIYDIAGNSWTTGAAGGTARQATPASVEYNGKIYHFGGAGSAALVTAVDIYDVAGNSWTTGVTGGTTRKYIQGLIVGNVAYIWGGGNFTQASIYNTMDKYVINSSIATSLVLGVSTNDPVGTDGAIYYNTASDSLKCYNGSLGAWNSCLDTISSIGSFINGGNAFTATSILGNTTAQALNIITNNTTRLSVSATGSTSITGGTTGDALTVSNSTSTGNILVLNDNASAVFTVADGGTILQTSGATTGTSYNLVANSLTTGTGMNINSTGVLTTTGNLLTVTANSATTATGVFTLNTTGLTQGYAQNINVNSASTLTTGGALNIVGPTGAANLTGGTGLLRVASAGAFTTSAGVGGLLQVSTATVTGTAASIVGTGVMTGAGNLLTLTANSATTATGILTVNATALTSGAAVNINTAASALAINATGRLAVTGTANDTLYGATATVNGTITSTTNTQTGLTVNTTITPSGPANLTHASILAIATTSSSNLDAGTNSGISGFNGAAIYTGTSTLRFAFGGSLSVANTSTGTITSARALYIPSGTNSGGGTISYLSGITMQEQSAGTNNVNLFIRTGTTTPTGNWNIYSESAYDNALAGALRVGSTTAPTVALDVTGSGLITQTSNTNTLSVVNNSLTTATGTSLTTTGVLTGAGNLLTVTANNATTATGILTVNATALTSGAAVNINAAASALAINATGRLAVSGTASNGVQNAIASIGGTVASTGADLMSGLKINPAITVSVSSDVDTNGLYIAPTTSTANLNTGSASLNGIWLDPTYSGTGTLVNLGGVLSGVRNSSSGTITNAVAVGAYNAVNSGTITNNMGINIEQITGGTNNTNLLIGTITPVAGNWSIYSSSAYNSAISGNLRVGSTTAPTSTLDVTGTLAVSHTVTNASGNAVTVNPSFTGGATNSLTYNAFQIASFSPTNAAGTDTVNGISIGALTDPGATITSTGLIIGAGWDTGISVATASSQGGISVAASAGASGIRVTTTPAIGAAINDALGIVTGSLVGSAGGSQVSGIQVNQSGAGALSTSGAGTLTFLGVSSTTPNITQGGGAITATGLNATLGTITTGGTQIGLNITPSNSNATGTVTGVNIANITAGAATENGISIGTGWDSSILFVTDATHTIRVQTQDTAATAGSALQVLGATGNTSGAGGAVTVQSGQGGTTGTGGALTLQGGSGGTTSGAGGLVTIQGGNATAGASNGGGVSILGGASTTTGTASAITITAGAGVAASNTAGGVINITSGAGGGSAAGGAFNILGGQGGATGTGGALTVRAGTGGSTSGAGGVLTLQGGNGSATSGNGGDVLLVGGTATSGTKGLVVLDTATYSAATTQAFTGSANISQANIDAFGTIRISSNAAGYTASLTDPTNTTAGRLVYISNVGTFDMILAANSGVETITLKPNTSATMLWNGVDWTAAGASSATDLQAAYDNTSTSAGGAELILNAPGGNADGFTIRNNNVTPITGGLLEVQTSIGSNLFTVNNNAIEYATNGGAETAGASSSTFPATTWDTTTGGTVSRFTTIGDNVATGQASVSVVTTTTNHGARNRITLNGAAQSLTSGLTYTVSFAARASTASFSTLQVLYSPDGTTTGTTQCATAQTVTKGQWTRITCTFVASGTITTSNSILIRQTDATGRTFYIDNLSLNVNASVSYAADGSVDNAGAFATNWTNYQPAGTATVAQETSIIYDTNASARVTTTGTAGIGMRNNLAVTPQINTQYLVSFYARASVAMTSSLAVGFLPAGGTGAPTGDAACTDYSTQSLTTTGWVKVTCLFTTAGTAISNADLVIYQTDTTARIIYVDALSITLNTNNSNNVQVGGANKGGPVTLFTLDRSSTAPIAANNEAYLGSMYYDTTSGRIQCYEADGWGACGAAPDNIVNLNPEYAGAVLNGSGVGTMTSDFCGNGGGLSVNTGLCASGEAKNFYKWTSPQATQQTYSIYVTYQLPATFDGFTNDDTVQLAGRVDNTTNASVTYEMFKSLGGTITQCGSGETNVITGGGGSANTWYSYGINGNEATGCTFDSSAANGFVIFKINMKANSNASAYVGTLNFVTKGR